MCAKQSQEVVFGRRQVDELALAQHPSALEIDLQIANSDDGFRSALGRRNVTHRHANAREQLVQSHRLGEVVVSPRLEHGDLVVLSIHGPTTR